MTASAEIVTETRHDVLAVPIQSVAVRTPDQLSTKEGEEDAASAGEEFEPDKDGFVEIVWLVEDDKAVARQVETGIQSETHIQILDGIEEGEQLVTGNFRAISKDLENGSEVLIQSDDDDQPDDEE